MATNRFLGVASEVAQVDTLVVGGTIEIGDVFNIIVTGTDGSIHIITYTAVDTVIATVVAGLVAAWNASTEALCTPITAADASPNVTLTAAVAGVGFSVTVETTEAGGGAADTQTFTTSTTTVNSGPKDWSVTDNWSLGVLPGAAAGHDAVVDGAEILYGLDQSGIANTLASLNIIRSQIGSNPATGYIPIYLQIKATSVIIGQHTGPGTSVEAAPVNIDLGSTASTIIISNTGTNSPTTMPAVRILANSSSTTLHVNKGNVGIALVDGETATLGSVSGSYTSNRSSDSKLYIGAGVTLTTANFYAGQTEMACGATTVNIFEATLTTIGEGLLETVNQNDGTFYSNSSGTITTLNNRGGITDFLRASVARIVTTLKLDPGGSVIYDPAVLTLTNKIQPYSTSGPIKFVAEAA